MVGNAEEWGKGEGKGDEEGRGDAMEYTSAYLSQSMHI